MAVSSQVDNNEPFSNYAEATGEALGNVFIMSICIIAYPVIIDIIASFSLTYQNQMKYSQNRHWGVTAELRIVVWEESKDNRWGTSFRPGGKGGGGEEIYVVCVGEEIKSRKIAL